MSNKIKVGTSKIAGAGRGVFATADIRKNETIEICPVIIIEEDTHLQHTILQHYIFEYTKNSSMLALGWGSLYNHHVTPNAKYELQQNDDTGLNADLFIIATRKILKGEEIYINYGPHYDEIFK